MANKYDRELAEGLLLRYAYTTCIIAHTHTQTKKNIGVTMYWNMLFVHGYTKNMSRKFMDCRGF